MDIERIDLLLRVFHATIDVPHTDKIRAEIMEELAEINNPPVKVEEIEDPEPELTYGARKL